QPTLKNHHQNPDLSPSLSSNHQTLKPSSQTPPTYPFLAYSQSSKNKTFVAVLPAPSGAASSAVNGLLRPGPPAVNAHSSGGRFIKNHLNLMDFFEIRPFRICEMA
ncbi:hypothetical protein, partial [Acidiphilium sp.]|uniref:hypothetical protein n=1 Tax=Acidiphilium sp. TaxID=527 RepID=UPI00258AD873